MSLPTNQEQEMLELLNRARANPQAEVSKIVISDAPLTGANADITNALTFFNVNVNILRQQLAGVAAVAPLAWNSQLEDAAAKHSAVMIQVNQQTHQAAGEPGLGDRITAAGYTWSAAGENIFTNTNNPVQGNAAYFVDWGGNVGGMQSPPGHRNNMLSANFTEVGIDMTPNPGGQMGPFVNTENYGNRFNYAPQLVGVVFRDGNGDNFYQAGEGLGGKTVSLTGANGNFSTQTWASGGYQVAAPAGTYTLTFSGDGIKTRVSQVTIAGQNVKVDDNDALAAARLKFNDTAVSDTFTGDTNIDTVVYARAQATITASISGNVVTANGTGTDKLTSIERLQFNDGVLAFDIQGNAGDAYRMYQAAFNRTPDKGGLSFWVNGLDTGGNSLSGTAQGFVKSAEFKGVYGTNPTNASIVDLFYKNVLGRPGEAGGVTFWTGRLDAGAAVSDVLIGFANSNENHARVDPTLVTGISLSTAAFLV